MVDKKKFLHVGCGANYKDNTIPVFASEDWQEVRLDIDKSVKPDIVSSVLDLGIIDSESFDAIFSSHNIEHVYAHEVPIMLKEFFLLAPASSSKIHHKNVFSEIRDVLNEVISSSNDLLCTFIGSF